MKAGEIKMMQLGSRRDSQGIIRGREEVRRLGSLQIIIAFQSCKILNMNQQ